MDSASIFSLITSTPLQIVVSFSSELLENRQESCFRFQVPVPSFPFSMLRLRLDFRKLNIVLIPLSMNPLFPLCIVGLFSSEATSIFSSSVLLVGEAGSEVMLLAFNSIFLLILLPFNNRFSKQVDDNH